MIRNRHRASPVAPEVFRALWLEQTVKEVNKKAPAFGHQASPVGAEESAVPCLFGR